MFTFVGLSCLSDVFFRFVSCSGSVPNNLFIESLYVNMFVICLSSSG